MLARKSRRISFVLFVFSFALFSCGDQPREGEPPAEPQATADTTTLPAPAMPPVSHRHFVLDPATETIYEIDLRADTIANRFEAGPHLKVIAFDAEQEFLYKGFGAPTPALEVFSPDQLEVVKLLEFPEPVSDMLFHPIKRQLFLVSEDSTNFKTFNCDSLAFEQDFPLHVVDKGMVGPIRVEPGPAGKVITANGDRASVTQVLTENNYLQQTITNHLADRVDYAVFSRDGNASYSCDTRNGSIYKIQFGSGEILAQLDELERPRHIQIEINSNTVVVVVGDAEVLMLHPDTFTETGRVSLADYGDEIISLELPPRANFVDVTIDYKGVTRWLRLDVRNWELLRMVELL
jgi:hypothetical protein